MGVAEKVFSGQFTHSKIEDALNEICRPLGLQYEMSDIMNTWMRQQNYPLLTVTRNYVQFKIIMLNFNIY